MIMQDAQIDNAPESFWVTGCITEDNLPTWQNNGRAFIRSAVSAATIHLSELSQANSLVVALLLDWQRYASAYQKVLIFVSAPFNLISIVNAYGLTDILSLENA